ncbi:hypothetical protein DICPUDRAFT_152626 [Dictyostelium purpureum]|uniref:MutL DNA mismatch repair protein n=1 Tax=Dictyostelium purpureum TaxID=5786 RepID=F0ZLV8_DICPU|nr:uncharacterized protein DICPUDRAFT_152626 [Dictyostelium purpureum]EGC35083.1 hypothetical protein DICPUDRAFT_152626 [Dictyostelium purpureum]|eukprot:XP_003288390.1 hypothetical protein DICPUDRAFT_152626 [Dictyostelium purpureum]
MIKAIDKESVNNICSGQVIFDLSIAVKELIENSIDAGATSIEIRLKEYGEEIIEVIDNGSGVEPSNFEALTMKHYTSKLEQFSDLLTVETFGFRGEALSSLCALSNVTVITRTANYPMAQKLVFATDGKIMSQSPIAREVGTTVQLINLFKKLPVRYQEFKRNIKKEYTKLQTIIQAYALISTGKRITCYNQAGKAQRNCVISTSGGNSTLRDNIASIFGSKMSQSLDEFTASDNLFKVNGLISKIGLGNGHGQSIGSQPSQSNGAIQSLSSLSRSCADRQFFFINGRPFEHSKLAKEINTLYHQFHKRGAYPVVVFNIETPTDNYDVNVTPDKRTIFIQKESQLLLLISDGLKTMWEKVQSIFDPSAPNSLTFDEDEDETIKKKNFSIQQSKISSFPNIYQLKSEEDEENKKKKIINDKNNNTTTTTTTTTKITSTKSLNISINSDDSFDIQPLKKQKHNNSTDSNKDISTDNKQLPKTPHPSKKLNLLDEFNNDNDSSTMDGDDYTQPTVSNKNKTVPQTNSPSSSQNTILDDNEYYNLKLTNLNSSTSNFSVLDDFEFKGTSSNDKKPFKIVNTSPIKKINNTNDNMNNNNTNNNNNNNNVNNNINNINNKNNNNKNKEDENENDSGYQQKNSKTFDITIKTDIEQIKKQYLIRNGTFDEDNNPVIPNTALVFTSIDGDDGSNIDLTNDLSPGSCCTIDHSLPQLDGKFSSSLGGIGVKATQQQQQIQQQQQAELELTKYFKKEYFKQMIVIGQFNLGFIIAKLGNDLFIIDQHAADEKYNFEMLSKSLEISSQPLIKPDPLSDLTCEEEMIIIENIDLFKKNGFKFIIDPEAPPRNKIQLSAFPMIHGQTFGIKDVYELIYLLKESPIPGSVTKIPRLNTLLASKACRKSIMVGNSLCHKEMKDVLNNLSTLDNPWCCPHGRPTMRHLIDFNHSLKKVQQQQQNKKDKEKDK